MKNRIEKIMAIIMLIALLVNLLPFRSIASFITDINGNADLGVISGSLATYGHELHYANYDNGTYILFCTQFGIKSPSGKTYVYGSDFVAEFKANKPEYERIAEMIYFGYAMNYGLGLPSSYEAQVAACCTQQYVWEAIGAGAPGRDSWNSSYMSSTLYLNWENQTNSYYNQYHSNISFNNTSNKVNIDEEAIFTDSNGVLKDYESFNQSINGVIFSHDRGNNDLKVVVTNEASSSKITFDSINYGLYQLMPNGNVYSSGTMSNYVYFQFTSGTIQNLIFSNYVNPSTFNISIEVQTGDLLIKKENDLGNPVSGCEFELYKDKQCTQKISDEISGDNGEVLFSKLKVGTYFVKEIAVTKGYIIDDTIKEVDIVNGQTSEIEVVNYGPTGEILINKKVVLREDINTSIVDVSDLSGIEFELMAKEDILDYRDSKIIYKKGETIENYNLNEEGTLKITDLPMGEYELKEVKTLDGLVLSDEIHEISFAQEDFITSIYEIKEEILNDTTLFEFSKTDVTGDKELEGAELIVMDENGEIVDSWISTNQTHKIEGLVVGKKYILREEVAPEGFYKTTDIEFEVENTSEIQKIQMIDEQIVKTPNTGDSRNILFFKIIVGISISLLILITTSEIIKKERRKHKSKK